MAMEPSSILSLISLPACVAKSVETTRVRMRYVTIWESVVSKRAPLPSSATQIRICAKTSRNLPSSSNTELSR